MMRLDGYTETSSSSNNVLPKKAEVFWTNQIGSNSNFFLRRINVEINFSLEYLNPEDHASQLEA